jgi:hypothetical protein
MLITTKNMIHSSIGVTAKRTQIEAFGETTH